MIEKKTGIYRGWPLLAILFVAVTFYFIFDPLTTPFMPRCVFHEITGLQCMGCGSQRMVHALLHGNIAEAFRANALITVSLPFLFFLVWLEISRKKYPRLYARVYSQTLIWGSGAVLATWFVARNLLSI